MLCRIDCLPGRGTGATEARFSTDGGILPLPAPIDGALDCLLSALKAVDKFLPSDTDERRRVPWPRGSPNPPAILNLLVPIDVNDSSASSMR